MTDAAPSPDQAPLVVSDLCVDRGGRAVLHGVSMRVRPGEITALLGPNGAGKSTLVGSIVGALPVRGGRIEMGTASLLGLKPHAIRRMGIALAQEGHPVLNGLSTHDNLRAAALMLSRAEAEHEIAAALDVLPELKPRLNVEAQDLSGGQKQMVNIAQALIARPRFLLIDELSFGLAPAVVARLGEVIKTIAARGVGVLLIEQFTTLALALAGQAYVMERGRLVYGGTSRNLSDDPDVLAGAYLARPAEPPRAVPA